MVDQPDEQPNAPTPSVEATATPAAFTPGPMLPPPASSWPPMTPPVELPGSPPAWTGSQPWGPSPQWAPLPAARARRPVGPVLALLLAGALAGATVTGVVSALRPTATTPAGGVATNSSTGAAPGTGSGGANRGNGSGGNAAGGNASSLDASSVAARVDPAIVDINTELGFQGASAAGTGVVLTSTGEVLTNNHVIKGATRITATDIGNGTTYDATVVGYDESGDIAVLQLSNASNLATAAIGDSSSLTVGTAVLALGNAGGAGGTPSVAAGAVTALGQSITASDAGDGSSEQLSNLVQVSAVLQSGDSGGPLVNAAAQVIGIDTAGSSSGGGGGGFRRRVGGTGAGGGGFAIPIASAMTVARQIEQGQASTTVHIGTTAFLGVAVDSQQTGSGAVITGAQPGTPAAGAGLAAGDTITAIDGHAVDSPSTLSALLVGHHPGDAVRVSWTDSSGGKHTVTVTLAAGPAK